MIKGLTFQLPIIEEMINSPFEFFAQGSRTAGYSNTDWDFYAEHSSEVFNWLRARNFCRGPSVYADALTVNVLRYGHDLIDLQVDVALIEPGRLHLKHRQVEIVKPYLGQSKKLVHSVAKVVALALTDSVPF